MGLESRGVKRTSSESLVFGSDADGISLRLGYRPPFDFPSLLSFYGDRALLGVEVVDGEGYSRAVRLECGKGKVVEGWFSVQDDPSNNQLLISMDSSLTTVVPFVVGRIHSMFDIDCDPLAVAEGLQPLQPHIAHHPILGTRVPGCFDPFEIACRAVLGQQISVQAANKLAARIVEAYGEEVSTGKEGLSRVWPTAEKIIGIENIEDAFGHLGVIKTRSRVLRELAARIVEGDLEFGSGISAEDQIKGLLQIKGVGPWTANYIAMRALGHPDAFMETDAGVAHALPGLTPKERLALAEGFRPWRSYAVVALWNSLATKKEESE